MARTLHHLFEYPCPPPSDLNCSALHRVGAPPRGLPQFAPAALQRVVRSPPRHKTGKDRLDRQLGTSPGLDNSCGASVGLGTIEKFANIYQKLLTVQASKLDAALDAILSPSGDELGQPVVVFPYSRRPTAQHIDPLMKGSHVVAEESAISVRVDRDDTPGRTQRFQASASGTGTFLDSALD